MGIIRDSFVVFKNWTEAINALPEEYQLETYKALVSYGLNGLIPEGLSSVANAMLISFSAGMENNILRYNASVENGKKGGRPRKTQQNQSENMEDFEEPNKTQQNLEKPRLTQSNLDEPNHNLYVNDNVNVNDYSLSINKNKLSEHVRACERVDELEIVFYQHFKDYFNYWGQHEDDKQIFNEILHTLSEATLDAKNNQLRFYQMPINLDKLIEEVLKLDEQDVRDIVWQIMNNQEIRDRKHYILGALFNRAKEKGNV